MMSTPPGLLACACALWASQTGQWLVAAAAAAALEAPRLVALRWNVAQAHFNRLSDFCSVLIVAIAIYLYVTFGNPRALMLLFQWLPILLLPLALAQAWGNLREVGVAAFAWTLRKGDTGRHPAINLGHPYFAVWVIAAAASNMRGPVFFAALAGIVAWALWSARPRRSSIAVWTVLVAAAAGGGYGLQHGLQRTQAWIEEIVPEWLSASGSRTDPYRSRTDLGHIGSLKQDDAIVLRVRAASRAGPLLLHRASYNTYFDGTWSARNAPLVPHPAGEGMRWSLRPGATPTERITVYDYAPRGNPVLSLPSATVELGLEALGIRINALGTIQADSPPGYFTYVAAVSDAGIEADPNADDMRIPPREQELFQNLVEHLGLAGLAPGEAGAGVRRYFADGFGYSLNQGGGPIGRSALADFVQRTRAGHCEYFATATVLLLRAAGVPARYATGFSAQEYSRLEDAYIVRVRHAHAWARAYVDGRWVDIDTTPATWAAIEDQAASWWAPLSDLASWARFRLSQLGGEQGEARTTVVVAFVALLVGLWFAWRLYRQRGLMVLGRRRRGRGLAADFPGSDSELYLVERALERSGLGRAASETITAWLDRIDAALPAGCGKRFKKVALLHYRYRFDPVGLQPGERAALREHASAVLRAVEERT